jgi:hypothetical protein
VRAAPTCNRATRSRRLLADVADSFFANAPARSAAPGELSDLRGRRAQHPDRDRTEMGRVNQLAVESPRARRARRDLERPAESDPLAPPGRRCSCWPTSPIPFYELRIGATMARGRSE